MSAIVLNSAVDNAWEFLLENCLVEEQTLQVACAINGFTMETIDSVCYALYGVDFGGLEDDENGEVE